jgi:hypothetical protein
VPGISGDRNDLAGIDCFPGIGTEVAHDDSAGVATIGDKCSFWIADLGSYCLHFLTAEADRIQSYARWVSARSILRDC